MSPAMPSATGQNWEKYAKKFADDEVEEKKITPLSDEYASSRQRVARPRLGLLIHNPGIYKCSRHMAPHPMPLP